jgi:hypothetical protein
MPAIRFPSSAVPLLPLCKGHGENYIFRTYADFINLMVAYGFHLHSEQGQKIPNKPTFVDNPNPINLEVFENRGLYSTFVMLALAYDDSRQVAEDEEQLTSLIERYAYLGAWHLAGATQGKTEEAIRLFLCEIMSEADPSIKI